MRKVNWQELDKPDIIDLIINHNASIGALDQKQKQRIRNKLSAMSSIRLWEHINNTYGGILYEPDTVKVDDRELLRRAAEASKTLPVRRTYIVAHTPHVNLNVHNVLDEAETVIYGWNDVHNVIRLDDLLVVLVCPPHTDKITKRIHKQYPTVKVDIRTWRG